MGKAFIDRTGHRYGKLTVTAFLGKPAGKTKPAWQCVCDCGATTVVTSSNLATHHTESCGCLLLKALTAKRIYKIEDIPEYTVWRSIRQRTGRYPGKNRQWYTGITMSDEWKESFKTFLADMGKRPSSTHSIERLDYSLGYCKDNCVWATPQEQANNRYSNHILTFNNESLTLAQWSRRTGISAATLRSRIVRYGWSIETALSIPTRKKA